VSVKTRVVPAAACLLAALAIGGVVTLEQRASASHNAEVKVLATVNELNALQSLPWLFDRSASVARGQLTAGEAQISATLAQLQHRDPSSNLQQAQPMLAANFAALHRIYTYSASSAGRESVAKSLAMAQVGTLGSASTQLAGAQREYSRAGYWDRIEAVIGAATAIILLLGAFGFFYRRSGRTLRQLAAIVGSSDDAISSLTLGGTLLSWNAGAERMYGYTAYEVVGLPASILMPPSRYHEFPEYLERLRLGGGSERFDTTRLHKDGRNLDVTITLTPITDATGTVTGIAAAARNITGQNRVESALRRSEENYRELFEQHPSPLWVCDPETLALLAVNDASVATYGYSRDEFLSMTTDQFHPVEERELLRRLMRDPARGRVIGGAWKHVKKDGTVIDVAVSSNRIEFEGRPARLALCQDVTTHRRLEEQLREVQKMEAIGSLAGGIAHDFNNILMVIRGYSSILLKTLSDEKQQHQVLQIDEAAERAAELTHQMLAFSRQQVLEPEVTDVNAVIVDALALLERVLGEDITLECDLDPGLGTVLVDRGQLGQVMVNTVGNARDAMHGGGTLSIRTENVDVVEDAACPEIAAGSYVVLRITDTGVGMDEETQARAFDPFFTTKKQGTGLGLATVYGIVKQSGGHISVSSKLGHGTTLEIYFPRVDASVATTFDPEPGALDGNETILVVEDTDTVRALVATSIASYGYTVLQASNGAEAIQLATQHAGAIDLLLTDVVMPEMNGRELAERLVADYPKLKVLFTSGYPADAVLRRGIAMHEAAFIEKPYPMERLALKLREVLGAPERSLERSEQHEDVLV
jgi:two-component system cell cycle sensor histidine kinase/response regulator CckA